MQSKLDLSWPSSCLYTVTLAFPCINWVLENSLKNVLFCKKPPTVFIGQVHVPTSDSDFFSYIYILLGHTFKFLQRNLFHTLSKTELKDFFYYSGCCFDLKYFIGIFAYFLPYANSASMARLWSNSSLYSQSDSYFSYVTPDLNLFSWDDTF